jgi:Fe-S cluster assembly ATP-binding protein
MKIMLKISSLSVLVQDKKIIKDCSQDFASGLVHVVMGPNGSGKSSLVATIMGHPSYQVESGTIFWNNQEILSLPVHQRAAQGIFLANQHPVEIQGLKVIHFLQEIYTKAQGKSVSIKDLIDHLGPLLKLVGLAESILERSVNVGFSGGEKKRFELLQMLLLKPKLVILDELDSGVDVDGLKDLGSGLAWYKSQIPQTTFIMITHYGHILKYFKPDQVHVMVDGRIVALGDSSLAYEIEQNGYSSYAKGC